MINLKRIPRIFDCYNFEQILNKLNEGKSYLEKGEEEFPIEFADSLWFLEELEDLFKGLVYSGLIKSHWEENWVFLSEGDGNGFLAGNHLRDYGNNFNILRSEMQMVLTPKNMESYLSVTEFINNLMEVIDDENQ